MIEKIGWNEWLCKTNFSFLTGASHPEDIIQRAQALDYNAIAISDYDGVYGLARTHLCHKRFKAKQKLIYGAELSLDFKTEEPILLRDSVVAIAKSKLGYKNLNQIINYSHRKSKNIPELKLDDFKQFSLDDLIFLQPMRGILRKRDVTKDFQQRRELLPNYHLCVSRLLHPSEDHFIASQQRLARDLSIPKLYTQDSFFHIPQQKPVSDLLHSIRTNLAIPKATKHFFPNAERFLHKPSELQKIYSVFPDLKKSLEYSTELSDSIDFSFSELSYRYPKEMIPEGIDAQAFLEKITWEGARKRFPFITEKVRNHIHRELELIKDLGFADYFLTVWDIVRWARSQNILCQGRGSAANSSVCYVLEITAVDPNNFDLLFERFISKERGDPPDIDVDFEHERREEVIQYIYERYGRARAAMVANVICFKKKGAMRAVGKALGFSEDLLSSASRLHQSKAFRGKATDEIIENVKEEYVDDFSNKTPPLVSPQDFHFEKPKVKPEENFELWQELSRRILNFPRHLGIHSGGFIIAQNNLDELVAQEPASMVGRSVIQWCKEDIEGLGFFKIDVLALGMLTAIRKTFDSISDKYQRDLDLYNIPADDPATYSMIQKADTVGVFQIESRAQMSMLPRLRPKCFYDLVIEIAIIRPGPIQGGVIHPYLKRRQGLEPVVFPSEKLRPILSKTLGVTLFQEQAMRIAIEVGDFSPGESNELRKNIGSWNLPGYQQNLPPMLEKLERGMRKNGLKEHFIKQLLQQMRGFAEYGFPESHAISFAYIAYASSFLKCHYPAAFFTAVLNSQPMGFYSPHALLQAAQRDGVKVYPVCIQNSNWDVKLEPVKGKEPPLYAIRMGFRLVNSLGKRAAQRVIEAREKAGPFKSFEDFLSRCLLYRDELTALAATDCFKVFGLERKEALWLSEALPIKPLVEQKEKKITWQKENSFEKVEKDFRSFGTSLENHPVTLVKQKYWPYDIPIERVTSSKDFSKVIRNQIIQVFGMILVRQAPPSAKGMVFLTLEDEHGFINLAISPQVYKEYYPLIENQAFICVKAKMQREGGAESLWVKSFYLAKSDDNIVSMQSKRVRANSIPEKRTNLQETKKWIEKHKLKFKELRELTATRNYQ